MNWITRARPKTDRIACAWLIRRFIDPAAVFHCVSEGNVLEVAGLLDGKSFDSPGADCGQWCTFEILVADFDLGVDPSLARLAAIVHAADIAADVSTDPLGPGLQAIGLGGLDAESDDQQLLASGMFVYDALYAWCAQRVAATAASPA